MTKSSEKNRIIKEHWNTVAGQKSEAQKDAFPLEYCGTHKDFNLQSLEINTLLNYIKEKDRIVDIGCGRGYATLRMAWKRRITILGVDYSEEMIKAARENLHKIKGVLQGDAAFTAGDVLNLKLKNKFDTAITQRCLINIPTRSQQKKAIENISKVIRKGGLLLLLEGSKQGLKELNRVRLQYGLPEIPVVWHNLFFNDRFLEAYASNFFKLVQIDNFCSTYMLVSRILHPALVFPKEPKYEAKINELAVNLPNYGDFGYEKLYVFRRK